LFADLGNLHGQAYALNTLGVTQEETGNYAAAAASQQRTLALFRDLGHRLGQAHALNDLGLVQQQTGDYPAAAPSHQQALALGTPLGQAEALNRLGALSLRTSATGQARDQHTQVLAIARDISAAPEEARALEGIGNSHHREGNPSQAAAYLQQALTIYQRLGAPGAQRVHETLRSPRLPGHGRDRRRTLSLMRRQLRLGCRSQSALSGLVAAARIPAAMGGQRGSDPSSPPIRIWAI